MYLQKNLRKTCLDLDTAAELRRYRRRMALLGNAEFAQQDFSATRASIMFFRQYWNSMSPPKDQAKTVHSDICLVY